MRTRGLSPVYQPIHAAVERGHGKAEALRACNALAALAALLGCEDDPRQLITSPPDDVLEAWTQLHGRHKWVKRHCNRVLAALCRALTHLPAPAAVMALRPRECAPAKVVLMEAQRSWLRQFPLHACLPLRLRRLSPASLAYRVIHELMDLLSSQLRSVSKQNLQTAATLLHHLTFDGTTIFHPQPVPTTKEQAWKALQAVTALGWIARYRTLYAARRPLSVSHFQRHICYLSLVHHRVLGGTPCIPAVTSSSRRMVFQTNTTTSSSSSSFYSHTDSAPGCT